jgi:hypothetical protein
MRVDVLCIASMHVWCNLEIVENRMEICMFMCICSLYVYSCLFAVYLQIQQLLVLIS